MKMFSKSLFVGLAFGGAAGIAVWLWNRSSKRLTSKKIKGDFKVAAYGIESRIARMASAKTSLVHENETLSPSTDNLNWTGTWGYVVQEYNGSLSMPRPAISVLEFIRAGEDTYCHFVPTIAIDRLISMNPGYARRTELVKGILYSSIKIMNEPPSRITGNSVKALNDVEGILEMSSKETAELTAICVPKVEEDLLLPTGTSAQPTTDSTTNQNQRSYSERSENVMIQTPLEMHSNDLVSTNGRNDLTTIDTVRVIQDAVEHKKQKKMIPKVKNFENKMKFQPVLLLNEIFKCLNFTTTVIRNPPPLIRVECVIGDETFTAEAATKKAAKNKIAISALNFFFESRTNPMPKPPKSNGLVQSTRAKPTQMYPIKTNPLF